MDEDPSDDIPLGWYVNFSAWLTEKVGVPENFLRDLEHEDDWTFIVKLHALIESGLNHMLTAHFRNEKLGSVFARLETSNLITGKVAFAKACELMGNEEIQFIRRLSEIRNHVAHEVSNVNFSLAEYVEKIRMVREGYTKWIKTISAGIRLSKEPTKLAENNPKQAMLITATAVLNTCYGIQLLPQIEEVTNHGKELLAESTVAALSHLLEKAHLRIEELEREAATSKE